VPASADGGGGGASSGDRGGPSGSGGARDADMVVALVETRVGRELEHVVLSHKMRDVR
jgi:hypothetical protein